MFTCQFCGEVHDLPPTESGDIYICKCVISLYHLEWYRFGVIDALRVQNGLEPVITGVLIGPRLDVYDYDAGFVGMYNRLAKEKAGWLV